MTGPDRCVACDNDLIEDQCPIHGDLTARVSDTPSAKVLALIGGTRWANEGDLIEESGGAR